MLEKIARVASYIFFFLFSWQTVYIVREVFVKGEKWQFASFGIYFSDLVLLILVGVLIFCRGFFSFSVMFRDKVMWILMALCAWTFLSVIWADESSVAYASAWRIVLMIFAFVVVRYSVISERRILTVFLISMVFHALFALWQWTTQSVDAVKFLGIAQHESWSIGTSVIKSESGRWLRAYGGYDHPNILGGALVMAIFFGAYLWIMARKLVEKVGFSAATLLLVSALIVSFSRSAWMGLVVGGMFLFFVLFLRCFFRKKNCSRLLFVRETFTLFCVNFWRKDKGKNKKNRIDRQDEMTEKYLFISRFFLVALFIGAVFLLQLFFLRDVVVHRFSSETIAYEGSISDRMEYVRQAFVMIQEHPIIGVGGGNFTVISASRYWFDGAYMAIFQPVHNVLLLIWAELGIIGLSLMMFLVFIIFSHIVKSKNILFATIFLALIPVVFFDHWLWTSHFGMMFLGVLLGLCCRRDCVSLACSHDISLNSIENQETVRTRKIFLQQKK